MTNYCGWCKKPVEGGSRNVGGIMQFFCPQGDCVLKLERRTNRRAAEARRRFREKPGWVQLKEPYAQGRWYKKKWLIVFKKGGENEWSLGIPDGRRTWRWARGACRTRAQAWKIATQLADLLERMR